MGLLVSRSLASPSRSLSRIPPSRTLFSTRALYYKRGKMDRERPRSLARDKRRRIKTKCFFSSPLPCPMSQARDGAIFPFLFAPSFLALLSKTSTLQEWAVSSLCIAARSFDEERRKREREERIDSFEIDGKERSTTNDAQRLTLSTKKTFNETQKNLHTAPAPSASSRWAKSPPRSPSTSPRSATRQGPATTRT